MFPSFIGILDIQSWWEVPSIAYFCSLFRTAFNLLDFDIEELEEALLTDGTEDSASSLLTELIVRLLNGCLGNNDISAFNYQMYLRRLFRRKCQETGRENPFDNDIDFQFLPLRTKVEILYALCDFRLDAEDVFDLFKNLEAESLRVEPLGWDDNHSAYWYFYGTRLYREDITKKPKGKNKKKKSKETKKRGWFYGDDWIDENDTERIWQVVCFTEEDWAHLTEKFSKATSKDEKELYRSLSQNFLPEIPRLFQEKERLQRKRLLELAPRRTSSRVLQKIKQKEEEEKQSPSASASESKEDDRKDIPDLAREIRARRRNLLRRKTPSSDASDSSESEEKEKMPRKLSKSSKKRSKSSSATQKGEPSPEAPIKTGRKTNNSLASATGQILIPDNDDPVSSTRKKLKKSQIFTRTEEDIQTDMYKVLEQLTAHDDAWPFMDPVEEEYAPNYYAVIRRPMDLHKMESRLDCGYYSDFSMFKADFKLIVNNCRLYNGQDNEYTTMVDNLQIAFDRLTEKYMNRLSSSDEEIAIEYQLPTPSRKHKLKSSESPVRHKKKKRKFHSEGEKKTSTLDAVPDNDQEKPAGSEAKKSKECRKTKEKKRRKGHHRHGKHSKNHKNKQEHSKSKHSRKEKHSKGKKNKDSKKSKKKKSKHQKAESVEVLKRSASLESVESSSRSRSASPLPSIHTLTPSPEPAPIPVSPPPSSGDFYKDKFDKIKERRRNAASSSKASATVTDPWDSLFDEKQKSIDKHKQNLHLPEKKDKNKKLRETIEKLKAKNKRYKDSYNMFKSGHAQGDKVDLDSISSKLTSNTPDPDDPDFTDDDDEDSQTNKPLKKGPKKLTAKNECATEALEQAVKDISKWLDDAPKASELASSPCDSPAQTISTEEQDSSRLDDEFPLTEKGLSKSSRKRPSSREPKAVKRREIQRTIDRLQPGKSKGNLLTNISTKVVEKVEEAVSPGPSTKVREVSKSEESSPKLSLGSVLQTVEFTLGSDHNFENEEKVTQVADTTEKPELEEPAKKEETCIEKKVDTVEKLCTKKDAEVETEPTPQIKLSQEKATPNLSAWFKAFGAPKTPAPSALSKKKVDDTETDDKADASNENKPSSPKNAAKYDSPDTPNADGGDSPVASVIATPRQRRTSTGSSVSERSSFSQDLDSPRHQMSLTSPLLRSPASPRTDDFQKISYPIINGTVRAGFYQDTTSMKSSPDKSCSPREAPQSPFSPYSQHVYASNSVMGSATPNYFVDHNKSPVSPYAQNPPPFYDTSKSGNVSNANKPRVEEYSPLGHTGYQQTQYSVSYTRMQSPYQQSQSSNHSPARHSPQPSIVETPPPIANVSTGADPKSSLYPVKKRSYNEPEPNSPAVKQTEANENPSMIPKKSEYQKDNQTHHSMPSQTPSVDEIALALTEKSELAKLNSLQVKSNEFVNRDKGAFECNMVKKDVTVDAKSYNATLKDNVDMVNMGYMNPDYERRNSGHERLETHDFPVPREAHMLNINTQQKGYEMEAIAMNLGMSSQQLQKHISKSNKMNPNNIPPAHSNERLHSDLINQNLAHTPFDSLSSGQPISNFSLNDIELANKKLYGCSTNSATNVIDYGSWKMTNPIRKQDPLPSDYSMPYSSSADKLRGNVISNNASAINYNKNLQHQQYNSYNVPRSNVHRTPEMQHKISSELRIPNPRSHLKSDHSSTSSISDTQSTTKAMDNIAKTQKTEKHTQNHPLVSPMTYKTPYSSHSSLPLDSLRIPQMLERYANDERYLSSFTGAGSSLYHEKSFEMAQMFNKSLGSDVHASSTSASIYSQSSMTMSRDTNIYKSPASTHPTQSDAKTKSKRKRTSDTKQTNISANQSYHSSPAEVLSSVKSSMLPGSAFNFSPSPNMALGGGLYGDNSGFSIEDFRTSTANQLMAANYMAAAVAHQQRNSAEANADKIAKPAHQSSSHTSGAFPYLSHAVAPGQVRGGYPFVGAETSSPLYQQYLQRHQEELLRQTGAQIMGLYPGGYPPALGVRQPYDSINRPSWL